VEVVVETVIGFAPAVAAMYKYRRNGTAVLVWNTAFRDVICVIVVSFYRTTRRYIPEESTLYWGRVL
jgi:hypothetical protein